MSRRLLAILAAALFVGATPGVAAAARPSTSTTTTTVVVVHSGPQRSGTLLIA